jgi:hypothetical protein
MDCFATEFKALTADDIGKEFAGGWLAPGRA